MWAALADRRVQSLIAIQFISMAAMEMTNPFWPLYLQRQFSAFADTAWAGVGVYVLPMLGMALTSVWWGKLGDRRGHKWMMARALLGLAISQLGLASASAMPEILLWRFVQGALAGFIAPAQAYGASLLQGAKPYGLFAALQISTNVGSLMGALLGGVLWQWLPFAWLNLAAGLLCAGSACAVLRWLPNVVPHVAASAPPVQAPQQAPAQASWAPGWRSCCAALVLALGLLVGARMVMQMPLSLYVDTVLKRPAVDIGLAYGVLALGFSCAALLWAQQAQKMSVRASLAMQLPITCALVVLLAALGAVRELGWFIAAQFVWGVLIAGSTPVVTAMLSRMAGTGQRGQVLGWSQSVQQLFSALAIGLGGWVVHMGWLEAVYTWVAALYGCAFLVLLALYRSRAFAQSQQERL